MAYFVVFRERGATWKSERPMAEQESWNEHAAFMNALVDDGFVILGGPLGHGPSILLIVNAETEEAVQAHLAADPWTSMRLLRVTKIEPWQVLLGKAPTT